ncbi:universal stress protein [Flavobacteriaceae bacterium KMM 6897]|nr:universal stress protein [Flavobacteriaceae bacterium KMM 6897]MEB8345212.1 universal stress protein [Flavobacteriaceae bacterium KMM 6898]
MKTILIPTDFSDNALNAISYAVKFFKYQRCDMYLMHAYADEVYSNSGDISTSDFEIFKDKIKKKVDGDLEKLLVKINEISPNPRHQYKTLSVFGSLIDSANDFVEEMNIDIVVMGTKGATNDQKLTFGSHTVQVLKYVQCPVLAIPENYEYIKPKKILFPTDYMAPYKRRELKLLCDLACSYRSEIHFLYLSRFEKLARRQEDNKMFLEGALQELALIFEIVDSEERTETIQKYIEINDIQLLVMVNSRHSFLENMLYQSTIDQLGLAIKVPFLVMQNLVR